MYLGLSEIFQNGGLRAERCSDGRCRRRRISDVEREGITKEETFAYALDLQLNLGVPLQSFYFIPL